MIKKNKNSFWTDPEGFSIVDVLALMFSFTFLGLIIYGFFSPSEDVSELLALLNTPIAIILGGYFTNQTVQQYGIYRSKSSNTQYNHPTGEMDDYNNRV